MTNRNPTIQPIERAWTDLAPKLIAFLAAGGLTTAALAAAAAWFGIEIPAEVAVVLVGGIASVASYIKRDNLLTVPFRELSSKVAVFILTSVSATAIVVLVSAFGVDLAPYSWAIGLALTGIGGLLGYTKSDVALAA